MSGPDIRTRHPIEWERPLGTITVPAGVRVEPVEGIPDRYWVAEFGWMDAAGAEFYRHDAIHYGIMVSTEDVEDHADPEEPTS